MRVTTGTVVNGRTEVSGETLREGTVVTVLSPDDQETFTLGLAAEAALLASRQAITTALELLRASRGSAP